MDPSVLPDNEPQQSTQVLEKKLGTDTLITEMDKDDEKNTMNDTTSVEHSSTVETKTTTVDSLDSVLANTNKETEYDSSDLELSSDDDSDEDEATDQDNHDDDDEDDEDGNKKMQQLRTVNEVTDIVINKPQFEMKEDTEIRPVGEIFSVIDKTVVVQSRPGLAVLDMESLLVFEDRVMLGEVFETFGPVERPFYSVRFNDADEIDRSHAIDGAAIYYVPSYERTQLVQVEKLKLIKGTDASNRYDEEVGAEELEFSDDEQEAAYRQSLKRKKKSAGTLKKRSREQQPEPIMPNRQLQSYADIMGHQQQRQHPDSISDLLNAYSSTQSRPDVTPSSVAPSTTTVDPTPSTNTPTSITEEKQEQPRSFFRSIRSLFSRPPPSSH